MANLDELYARGKQLRSRAMRNKLIALALLLALLALTAEFNSAEQPLWYALLRYLAPLIALIFIFGDTLWRKFFTAGGMRTRANRGVFAGVEAIKLDPKTRALTSRELVALEKQRLGLQKTIQKARLIALVTAFIVGVAGWKFSDIFLGAVAGVLAYGGTFKLIAGNERERFCQDFKARLITIIAAKYTLKYEPAGSLGLENFLRIYNCRVDKYHGEDLLVGQIDGVSVAFSDFYVAKEVRTDKGSYFVGQFHGVLFEADFHKYLYDYVSICHKDSANVATYGARAVMDDVRFSEYFRVYASDQIAARYALTPSLMQRFLGLCLRLNAPINALILGSKIYIAIETWQDSFEPELDISLLGPDGLARYECEIAGVIGIVKELNLRSSR